MWQICYIFLTPGKKYGNFERRCAGISSAGASTLIVTIDVVAAVNMEKEVEEYIKSHLANSMCTTKVSWSYQGLEYLYITILQQAYSALRIDAV